MKVDPVLYLLKVQGAGLETSCRRAGTRLTQIMVQAKTLVIPEYCMHGIWNYPDQGPHGGAVSTPP